jgi:hypothetical protein
MTSNGNNGDANVPITFRVPPAIESKFKLKCKQRGKRSRILRALLQMWLEGKIPEVIFKSEDRITISTQ